MARSGTVAIMSPSAPPLGEWSKSSGQEGQGKAGGESVVLPTGSAMGRRLRYCRRGTASATSTCSLRRRLKRLGVVGASRPGDRGCEAENHDRTEKPANLRHDALGGHPVGAQHQAAEMPPWPVLKIGVDADRNEP